MIPPDEPIHPLTAAVIALGLLLGITVRVAFDHGPLAALTLLVVFVIAAVVAWSLHEVLTLSREVRRRRFP